MMSEYIQGQWMFPDGVEQDAHVKDYLASKAVQSISSNPLVKGLQAMITREASAQAQLLAMQQSQSLTATGLAQIQADYVARITAYQQSNKRQEFLSGLLNGVLAMHGRR